MRKKQFLINTSGLFVLFAFGLVARSLQAVLVRGFYPRKDTLTPMLIGTLVVLAAIPWIAGPTDG